MSNLQCGGKLARTMEGSEPEVFARLLRGLASTKLTKPGNFRTKDGSAYALRCSYKVSFHPLSLTLQWLLISTLRWLISPQTLCSILQ